MTNSTSIWKLNLGIYGVYAVLTILITYPAIMGLVDPYTIPSTGADSPQSVWYLWWVKHAVLHLQSTPTYTNSVYHPLGGVLFLLSPFNEFSSITLQMLFGLTRSYSLLWLFSFPTAAFTTYLLAFYLTRNRQAAFVSGLIFSFSARHYAHATVHLNLMTIQWLPLYALALFLLLKKPSLKRTFLTTAGLVLAITSEYIYYLFYFIVPLTALFVIYHWAIKDPRMRQRRFWLNFILAMAIGLLLVFPLYKPLLDTRNDDFVSKVGIIKFSADLLAYFIPPENHPLAPEFLVAPYRRISGNPAEQTVFIGYIALILMIIGLNSKRNQPTKFWFLLGALAFIFSLGPILNIYGDVEVEIEDIKTFILLPYSLLVNLPFFSALRAPARLSVTVQLAVAMLAAYGMAALHRRWPRLWTRGGYIALGALILLETLFQFPQAIDATTLTPPPIYQQIARERNDLAVLELPLRQYKADAVVPVKDIDGSDVYYFMYYATIHEHPIVGGKGARVPAAPIYFVDTTAFVRELTYPTELNSSPAVLTVDNHSLIAHGRSLLAKHKIGYVVINRQLLVKYLDDAVRSGPEQTLRQALGEPFYDDGQFVGFRVSPGQSAQSPAEAILWGDGWFPEANLAGRPVRWMGQTGSLFIDDSDGTMLRLELTSFAPLLEMVNVKITVNDVPLDAFQVSPTPETPTVYLTRAFALTAGTNIVKFEALPAGTPQEWPDDRISLGVFNITPHPLLRPQDVAPKHPVQINLADKVEFLGFDVRPDVVSPGATVPLTLYWHALKRFEKPHHVFVHLLDSDGKLRAQHDGLQLGTTKWASGEVVIDDHAVVIPIDIPPGRYQIYVGMYALDTLQRLTVHTPGETSLSDAILLGTIDVKAP